MNNYEVMKIKLLKKMLEGVHGHLKILEMFLYLKAAEVKDVRRTDLDRLSIETTRLTGSQVVMLSEVSFNMTDRNDPAMSRRPRHEVDPSHRIVSW